MISRWKGGASRTRDEARRDCNPSLRQKRASASRSLSFARAPQTPPYGQAAIAYSRRDGAEKHSRGETGASPRLAGCGRGERRAAMGAARCAGATRRVAAVGRIRPVNLLALETSTDLGTLAVWHDGEVLRRACPAGVPHSQTLLPLARASLHELGFGFADLDAIAFAAGPGSFTGLRVACGVAQGLAFARGLPVLAVGTLEAMALASGGERVIVTLDARMGEVYCGAFVDGRAVSPIVLGRPDTVALPAAVTASGGWLACGNGLLAYPALRERLAASVVEWQAQLAPDAAAVARLGAQRLQAGEGADPADVAPLYVRNKVALTVAERCASGGRA